jgi:hypothetical protein
VASLALLVALTGTSVAAVSQLVPRNSVGTPQLRDNAVTRAKVRNNAVNSGKVANGSLLAVDFAAGQIPAGPAGTPGPTGPAGPAGPAGPGARWALVRPDGGIVSQSGGISLGAKPTAGRYMMNFGSDVTGKLILVSPGYANDPLLRGTMLAGPCGGGADGINCIAANTTSHVFVFTSDPTNTTAVDHSFYIAVIG